MEKEVTTIEYITPETAALYLQKNESNRPLKDRIVKFYLSIMQRGEWKLTNDAITFNKDGVLINGQHRLTALSKFNQALPFIVARGFDNNVFQCLDTGVARTAADVLAISNIPNYSNLAAAIKKTLVLEKRGTITNGGRGKDSGISNSMILEEYNKTPDRFQRLNNNCSSYYGRIALMTRSDMIGYCEYLIRMGWDEDLVCSFFDELCSLTTPRNSTLLHLRNRLVQSKIGKSLTLPTSQRQELLIKTWNVLSRIKH